ncbi:MAG: hypothetical protein Q8M71_09730 [Thermodesulfovibrionales bacterium]|nr:hypothetical protein [Thermodesulfovibrionales bacterium]
MTEIGLEGGGKMSTLLIKFKVLLDSDFSDNHGALFHRWLPNGEEDAILLDTGDSNTTLKVWFERWGIVDKGHIKYDGSLKQVDSEIMTQQAILEGGPLRGLLEIRNLRDEDLALFAERSDKNDEYYSLVKKVIKKLIYLPLSNFIKILRTNYGQYWLKELEKWDSREESLPTYCDSKLHIEISLDNGKSWGSFFPSIIDLSLKLSWNIIQAKTYAKYLTRDDWQSIQKLITEKYVPTYAAEILMRAYQLYDQGNLKHAIVEGVTAFEVAISEFIKNRLNKYGLKNDFLNSFLNLPLSTQIVAIAAVLDNVLPEELEQTLKIIKIRNDIVHEGMNPPKETKTLRGFFNTAAKLLTGPELRFLYSNIKGNTKMTPAEWEKIYQ